MVDIKKAKYTNETMLVWLKFHFRFFFSCKQYKNCDMKWAFNEKNDVERFQRSIIHYKSVIVRLL